MPNRSLHFLQEPSCCDHCCSLNIEYVTNDVLYGKVVGKWPYIWFCPDCRASVGCHENTRTPLGRMADKATKQLRKRVHEVFDLIWTSGLLTRDRAYQWLACELGIEYINCHIAWLTKVDLMRAEALARTYYAERHMIIERRKAKREQRNRLQIKRTKQRIKRRKRTGD